MRLAKVIGLVVAVLLLMLVNYTRNFFARADRDPHRSSYAAGEIKSALSQSSRLSEALLNRWGDDETQIRRMVRDFLRDDPAVVGIEIRNVHGEVVANIPFKAGTCVFPSGAPNGLERPVLSVLDGKRLNVQRAMQVGSNVVGILLMQRQTTVQLRPDDVTNFEQHGDGGSR